MPLQQPESQPAPSPSRRRFLATGLLAGGALLAGRLPGAESATSSAPRARRRLRLAAIGCGGRGQGNMAGLLETGQVEFPALCDVDFSRAEKTWANQKSGDKLPAGTRFADYRALLDRTPDLDGVVISTPDHMHAPIAFAALAKGLPIYCEKPLTRTVWEARRLAQAAQAAGVVTQMGNQGSALSELRRCQELLGAGILGRITAIHTWTDRPTWAQGLTAPAGPGDPVPATLDWDLWLGVATPRPYVTGLYHPGKWRAWHDFGAGAIGDIACHQMNLPFRACGLEVPTDITATKVVDGTAASYPKRAVLRYRFAEKPGRAACELWWYEGGEMPPAEVVPAVVRSRGALPTMAGVLILGEGGFLYSDAMHGGAWYLCLTGEQRLMGLGKHPAAKAVPSSLPRVKSHYHEFVDAIQGRGPVASPFSVGAQLTELGILGCIAERFPGRTLRWDAAAMRFPDVPEADAFLTPSYRPGFSPIAPA